MLHSRRRNVPRCECRICGIGLSVKRARVIRVLLPLPVHKHWMLVCASCANGLREGC